MSKIILLIAIIILASCNERVEKQKHKKEIGEVKPIISKQEIKSDITSVKSSPKAINRKIYNIEVCRRDTSVNLLVDFTNYNEASHFFKKGDSLCCQSNAVIKYYDQEKDLWNIVPEDSTLLKREFYYQTDTLQFPEGYDYSLYWSHLCSKKGDYILVLHSGEGGLGTEYEIVNTISGDVYNINKGHLTDFYIDSTFIWVSATGGISKINRSTLNGVNYYTLPAISEIKQYHQTDSVIYFTDRYYGIYQYDLKGKIITPIEKIMSYYSIGRYGFINSYLIGDKIYAILLFCGNAIMIEYDIRTEELKELKSKSTYLDSFLLKNDTLIVYGEKTFFYDGGQEHFWGAEMYKIGSNTLTQLTNKPIVEAGWNGDSLNLLSIQHQNGEVCSVQKYLFVNGKDVSRENIKMFARNYNESSADSIEFWDGKKYLNNSDSLLHYLTELDMLNAKRKVISDSLLHNIPIYNSCLKVESKPIRKYNFKKQ